MKNSLKQTILTIIFIVILFIPTYVAITYFAVKSDGGNRYSVEITSHMGDSITLNEDTDSVAKAVLKMNSKMKSTNSVDTSTLPDRFYDIKVTDKGTVYDYRYYFSTDKNKRTIVMDRSGAFYIIEFKNVKSFLSRECAYIFYDYSSMPILSIFGGDDIFPTKATWKYKAVNGSFINSPCVKTASNNVEYAMSGRSKLSFNITPDKYTVKVYKGKKEILKTSDFNDIPYEMLDSSSLYFVIDAEWTSSNQYRGSVEYKFYSSIAKAPEFFVDKTTIESGEFIAVTATNITAPHKIEFSISPSSIVHFNPEFFSEGEYVHALIPMDIKLLSTTDFTLTFKYGESESQIKVTVTKRKRLERDYNCSGITASYNTNTRDQYHKLLTEIGSKSESVRYFGTDFIDYSNSYGQQSLTLGYGHLRKPNNSDDSFLLDGVDYSLPAGTDIPSIAAGKVVYIGFDELLGNFVVVDHGFGLKTWYCHLGEVVITTGKIVTKGEILGKAGKTGYTNSNGVYLITTVFDVPVCPYSMQENGITFPTPQN